MTNSLPKNNQPTQEFTNRVEYIPRDSFHKNDSSGLDPRKAISLLLKYKWVVLAFISAGVAVAWFYADTVTPLYESSGTLLVAPGNTSATDELSQIISQATGYGTGSSLENELQVLRSRKFSQQVAQKLLEQEPADVENFPIYWQEAETGDLVRASKDIIANRIGDDIYFYQPVEEAEIVKVNYKSAWPEEAAKIVNLAMQNYIDNSTQQNRQAATSTADFLEKEQEKLEKKLQDAERELRNYMDATGIVQVNQQTTSIVTQRANAETELQHVTAELQAVKEGITNYKNQLDRISPGIVEQFTEAIGPRIRDSQEILSRHEQERALIISRNPGVLEEDPVPSRLQYLNKQIDRLKEEIRGMSAKLFSSDNEFIGMNSETRSRMVADIQSQLVELEIRRNQLESRQKAIAIYKNKMDIDFEALPKGMVELAKLQRDVRINEELYTNVSTQYSDISLLEQSQFGFGRLVDSGSIPEFPVSPNKKIFLLLGLMFGGAMAAGFIAIFEFRDNSVNNIVELNTIYLPPLNIVPKIEEMTKEDEKLFKKGEGIIPKEIVMLNNRSSFVAEAFRRLKNNIIFQNSEHPPKTIAITSPQKGDGKSTVSANLAISFAEEGYFTLVIDADFRRPKLQKYFGITDKLGLSNYLNDEISFENLLKETDLETLKLITAGRGAEMPEILSNKHKFKQLLKKMEDAFDVIIIDTPPYGVLSDSSALLKYAEATIVIARYQKTNKGMLLKTMEELKRIHANVINIVVNNFDPRNEVSNYYGDGYYQAMYSNYDQYT